MTVREVYNNDLIRLPISFEDSKGDFKENLKSHFNKFKDLVDNIEDDNMYSPVLIWKMIDAIEKCIDAYYIGKPQKAYNFLSEVVKKDTRAYDLLKFDFNKEDNFYRMRIVENLNSSLPNNEMFHIPFHRRFLVSNQRYSINGFPSLYISNSPYVAWEEMLRPQFERIHCSRLQAQKDFSCYNLRNDIYTNDYDHENEDIDKLVNGLILWPLHAACSVKVSSVPKDVKRTFVAEYIIPQILLQIISEEEDLYGITFSSTHIDLNNPNTNGVFYNIVIPVRSSKKAGYCDQLSDLLYTTDSIPMNLLEFSKQGSTIVHPETIDSWDREFDVSSMELIKGACTNYKSTPFKDLEIELEVMNPKKVMYKY